MKRGRSIQKNKTILTQSINNAVCGNATNPYSTTKLVQNKANTCAAYKSLKSQFNIYLAGIETQADAIRQKSDMFGAAVRLAFHDAGEVDIRTSDLLGPDGCLSTYGGNAGLVEDISLVTTLFEPTWQGMCGYISRADFWVLVAQLCLDYADPTNTLSFDFQYGRKDATSCNYG